jgi:hypothetical protein
MRLNNLDEILHGAIEKHNLVLSPKLLFSETVPLGFVECLIQLVVEMHQVADQDLHLILSRSRPPQFLH